MQQSFFKYLKFVENCVEGRNPNIEEDYPLETREAVQRLISYVEEGSFLEERATASRFICKHWRCSVRDIQKEWALQTGKDKSASAIRAQICNISKTLYQLFPEEEAFGEVLIDLTANYITRILDALEVDKYTFCCIYPEVSQYIGYYDFIHYDISELTQEIETLRELKRVTGNLKSLDRSKLGYIRYVLDSSIMINPNKSALIEALGLVGEQQRGCSASI